MSDSMTENVKLPSSLVSGDTTLVYHRFFWLFEGFKALQRDDGTPGRAATIVVFQVCSRFLVG
jgi:hypothetical protein